MLGRAVPWLLGAIVALGLAGWGLAGEGDVTKQPEKGVAPAETPKGGVPKQVDEVASARNKLTHARTKFIQSNDELKGIYKDIRDREGKAKKDLDDLYAKVRTMSKEVDDFEKELAAVQAKRDEERKAKHGRK